MEMDYNCVLFIFFLLYTLAMEVYPPEANTAKAITVMITLEDVLAFITGSSSIPHLSYRNKPIISFHGKKYREANTCCLMLHLPIDETKSR